MSNKSGEEKRINKSKEQLLQEAKQKEELKRIQNRIDQEFYPLISVHSQTIEDARVFCSATAVAIKRTFDSLMAEAKVAELDLSNKLAEGTQKERYEKLLGLLGSETIIGALKILEQLQATIDGLIQKELGRKKLSDLKPVILI